MDSTIESFQDFAGNILDLNLPNSSSIYKIFVNTSKNSDASLPAIAKIASKLRKITNFSTQSEIIPEVPEKSKPPKRISRSLTTIMAKSTKKVINLQNFLPDNKPIESRAKVLYNNIEFKLSEKAKPQIINYHVKQLKSQTIVYQNPKGQLRYELNPTFNSNNKKKFWRRSTEESSDQLLLSSENTLSDSYFQSIRIQNYIKRKGNVLVPQVYQSLTNKLSTINQTITNENSRISRSFYSL